MAAGPEFRVATAADLDAIGETLGRAFDGDPVWGWCFEGETRERKLVGMSGVFRFAAAAALDHGWVRLAGDAAAVALWIPAGEPEMSPADEARFPDAVREVCTPTATARVLTLMEAFDANHPHEPPHFYLSLLGTHPDHAGSGIGMSLVASNLAEIDALGAPSFLESSNPANVARYERAGFHPSRDVELVGGLSATQMWRQPS
jgi:GNAT superfamily N-acetyltransferase